jgi:hypothetical protein
MKHFTQRRNFTVAWTCIQFLCGVCLLLSRNLLFYFYALPCTELKSLRLSVHIAYVGNKKILFSNAQIPASGRHSNNFVTVAPNICGSSESYLFHITFLAPRSCRWLLGFWKVSALLVSSGFLEGQCAPGFFWVFGRSLRSWFLLDFWKVSALLVSSGFLEGQCAPGLICWKVAGSDSATWKRVIGSFF